MIVTELTKFLLEKYLKLYDIIQEQDIKTLIINVDGSLIAEASAIICYALNQKYKIPIIARSFIISEEVPRSNYFKWSTDFKIINLSNLYAEAFKVIISNEEGTDNKGFPEPSKNQTTVSRNQLLNNLKTAYLNNIASVREGIVVNELNLFKDVSTYDLCEFITFIKSGNYKLYLNC